MADRDFARRIRRGRVSFGNDGIRAACIYQAVLFETGISGAALITKDVSGELQLLKALGVIF